MQTVYEPRYLRLNISKDTASLNDFKQNTDAHLASLKESGRPEILTIDGKPQVVVQDIESYQALVDKAEYVETVKAVQAGIDSHNRGEGVEIEEAFEQINKQLGLQSDK
ncbi:MAG: prevent-host-death protein [Blastopirellula sp.]|nr:MAG: prevent-host-death protein [Blastopirellula sp.]